MITAHSGCEGTGIDTMDSIEKALEIGADTVEIDVRLDPFGNLRVSHDPLSLEEYLLKNLLEEVFRKIMPTSLLINFDIKEQKALYKTINAAIESGFPAGRMIMTGCAAPEDLLKDHSLAEKAAFFLNISHVLKYIYIHHRTEFSEELFAMLMEEPLILIFDEDTPFPNVYLSDVVMFRQKLYAISKTLREQIYENTLMLFQETRAKAFNIPKFILGTQFIRTLKTAGVPLSVWTVNEPDLIKHCLEMEVHNITTRVPRLAMHIRDEYAGCR